MFLIISRFIGYKLKDLKNITQQPIEYDALDPSLVINQTAIGWQLVFADQMARQWGVLAGQRHYTIQVIKFIWHHWWDLIGPGQCRLLGNDPIGPMYI